MLVKVVGTCVAVAGVTLCSFSTGQAATVPFAIKAPVKASWVVGSQVTPDVYTCDDVTGPFYSNADEVMRWSASGVPAGDTVAYTVTANTGEGPWDPPVDPTSTTYSDIGTNFDNDCGGGGAWTYDWTIQGTTSSGATAQATIGGGLMTYTQDTGVRAGGDGHGLFGDPPAATIAYTGTWGMSNCPCWSSKTTHKTTQKGASVTAAITVPDGQADHVGLVMAKGPDRGSARIYVDGVLNAVVNTYSATRQSRIIVWQRALGKGTHIVKVVNLATAGHPRIDLDGVLTN
jgi:hypothetical protein